MNYIALSVLTIVAIGFGARIVLYAKTKDPDYKHRIGVWFR